MSEEERALLARYANSLVNAIGQMRGLSWPAEKQRGAVSKIHATWKQNTFEGRSDAFMAAAKATLMTAAGVINTGDDPSAIKTASERV